jgi:DNA-binding transcriptional regulator YiaG
MKYESDILKMIHENAIANYKIGILSEAEMREYDELCLPPEALKDKTAQKKQRKSA